MALAGVVRAMQHARLIRLRFLPITEGSLQDVPPAKRNHVSCHAHLRIQ
jgi:hypothetical protein